MVAASLVLLPGCDTTLEPQATPDASSATGEAAGCTSVSGIFFLPLTNQVFVVDRSGSMGNPAEGGDPTQKWNPMVAAFTTFFQSVKSPAVHASLTLFPAPCVLDQTPGSDGGCVCSPAEYDPDWAQANKSQTVPLMPIVGNVSVFIDLLNNTSPSGGTPTIAALQGALTYANNVQSTSAESVRTSVILITDGEPGFDVASVDGGVVSTAGCTGNDIQTIQQLVQDFPTETLWVFAFGSLPALGTIVAAGGHPLVAIDVGDPAVTEQEFLNSLESLPSSDCTVGIPPPGIDQGSLDVLYFNAADRTPRRLAKNPGCALGDGSGWDPATGQICTPTCIQLEADPTTALFMASCTSP
jgi:hypothetical protein